MVSGLCCSVVGAAHFGIIDMMPLINTSGHAISPFSIPFSSLQSHSKCVVGRALKASMAQPSIPPALPFPHFAIVAAKSAGVGSTVAPEGGESGEGEGHAKSCHRCG